MCSVYMGEKKDKFFLLLYYNFTRKSEKFSKDLSKQSRYIIIFNIIYYIIDTRLNGEREWGLSSFDNIIIDIINYYCLYMNKS